MNSRDWRLKNPLVPAIGIMATCLAAALVLYPAPSAAQSNVRSTDRAEIAWKDLRKAHFDDRRIVDGSDVIKLDAPDQAEDAAVVPITITDKRAGTDRPPIERLWLVIDNNPVPMSAELNFGPAAASATIGTRVRVNTYTYVRVLADTGEDALYMVKHYVRAAGGCSAPIGSDPTEALKHMGEMRLRQVRRNAEDVGRSQLLIRHPNITGLQMDQLTRHVWPAHFVDAITIHQGDALVLDASMTFSLSENPALEFDARRDPSGPISVRVHDNKDNTFNKTWQSQTAHAAPEEEADT